MKVMWTLCTNFGDPGAEKVWYVFAGGPADGQTVQLPPSPDGTAAEYRGEDNVPYRYRVEGLTLVYAGEGEATTCES